MSIAAHDIQKFRTKQRCIKAFTLISAQGISIYNGPLLGYNSPSTSDASGLIYVDRMIISYN